MENKGNKAYDVVVIGAGNGGLTAAIRVLQGGYSCLLLEKHNLPGGFATSFKRGRFEFEASLHELNDLAPRKIPETSAPCSAAWGWRIRSTGSASRKPII